MPARDVAFKSSFVSVGATDTAIVAANPNRMEITLVNDGANIIYLQFALAPSTSSGTVAANAAVAGQGIRLNASGGSYTTQSYKGAVRGIALTGATNLTVLEL